MANADKLKATNNEELIALVTLQKRKLIGLLRQEEPEKQREEQAQQSSLKRLRIII